MNRKKAKRAALKAVQAIYDELPEANCRGLCQKSCHLTSDLVVDIELERLGDRMLYSPTFPDESSSKVGDDLKPACGDCPLLSGSGACEHYTLRPLICRLYGIVSDPLMICPHGCQPARYLSNEEARRLWARLVEINRRYEADHKPQSEGHEP